MPRNSFVPVSDDSVSHMNRPCHVGEGRPASRRGRAGDATDRLQAGRGESNTKAIQCQRWLRRCAPHRSGGEHAAAAINGLDGKRRFEVPSICGNNAEKVVESGSVV